MCPNKSSKKKSEAKGKEADVTEPASKNVSNNACCVPKGQVSCGNPEISNSSSAIKFRCSNSECPESGLMHQKCYDKFENLLVLYLGRHTRCRDWSQSKKQRSLWQDFGYDLIFKLCECECGHGYIKREGDNPERVEGVAAVQAYQEKKKKKANLKPKINYPMDKVSEKSVGTFTSHLNVKKVKVSKPRKGKSANYDIDGFDSDTTSESTRLNPPLATFNIDLSEIRIKTLKSKVKEKPSKLLDSKVDYDVVERYGEVCCPLAYIEQGNTRAAYGDDDSDNKTALEIEDSSSANGYLQTTELDYVYYSDDNDIECLEQKCSVEENTQSCIDSLQVYDHAVDMEAVRENACSEYSDKNLTELRNKLVRKPALDEVVDERNKLQEKVSFFQGSNVELCDSDITVAATEAEFSYQLDELNAAYYSEVTEKLKVINQNEYLKNFNQWLLNSRAEALDVVEANKVALVQQMKDCCKVIKAHDKAMLNRLENDKVKVFDNIQKLEWKVENLSNLVFLMKNKMEKLSTENLTLAQALSNEKKIVTELKEKLLKERFENRNKVKSLLESTLNSQQLFNEEDDVKDENVDELGHLKFLTDSVTSMASFDSEKDDDQTFKKQCSELKARNTEKRLDLLEASFKSIDLRNFMIEEKLSLQERPSKKDVDEENRWMKEKILDLTKYYCELQKASSKMSQNIDESEELIQGLTCSVNQQIEENIKLKQDVDSMEKKIDAFEEEKSSSRNTRQVWQACNWL